MYSELLGKFSLSYLFINICPLSQYGKPQTVASLLETLPLGEITVVDFATVKKWFSELKNPSRAWYFLSASTFSM